MNGICNVLLVGLAFTVVLGTVSSQDFSHVLNNNGNDCQTGGDQVGEVDDIYSPLTAEKGIRPAIDFHCLVSPEDVYVAWKSGALWLIDVRSPQDYQNQTIPTSLNVPGYLVKHKTQFKSGHTVLFNSGFRHRDIERLCHQLENSGFTRVSVLQGGVAAWSQAGYPVTGKSISASELKPSDYMSTLNERSWIIIGLDSSAQVLVDRTGASEVIGYDQDIDLLTHQIGQRVQSSESDKFFSFLVVSKTGNGYQRIKKALKGRGLIGIHYLAGGVEALRRYWMTNQAQMQRARQGFKKKDSCSG
ncbi:MAG: rhodanese-like domain-containing protein [Candidatus Thiodiazotropha sp.]|jgi:rhodanese-related sulfurtransferase